MDTLEVITKILEKNEEIVELKFVEIHGSSKVQESISSNNINTDHITKAMEIRSKYNFSFWEAVCATFINNANYSRWLLKKVYHHNCNKAEISISKEFFGDANKILKPENKYAILSKVNCKNERLCHIPFIDFHCESNMDNVKLVEDVITDLNIGPGYILNSGKSFHFIGYKLLKQEDFCSYLGKLLLYSPIIDKSWIAHQLIEQYCALRVTDKNGVLPHVVKRIYS